MTSRNRLIVLIILINVVLISATVWWMLRPVPLSVNCQGQLAFNERRNNSPFDYDGQVLMRFSPDGTGYFNMVGNLSTENATYQVSRQENFKWRHLHDSLYEIHVQSVQRFSHDHTPEDVFATYTAGIMPGQKRMLDIKRTQDNAIVVGNFYSPLLLCAN